VATQAKSRTGICHYQERLVRVVVSVMATGAPYEGTTSTLQTNKRILYGSEDSVDASSESDAKTKHGTFPALRIYTAINNAEASVKQPDCSALSLPRLLRFLNLLCAL
jgi:hypothetical protein